MAGRMDWVFLSVGQVGSGQVGFGSRQVGPGKTGPVLHGTPAPVTGRLLWYGIEERAEGLLLDFGRVRYDTPWEWGARYR